MFCSNCGAEVKDGMKFCPKCGAQLAVASVEPNVVESSGESANARQTEKKVSTQESVVSPKPSEETGKSKNFLVSLLFSFQGRAPRGEWWLVAWVLVFLAYLPSAMWHGAQELPSVISILVMGLAVACWCVIVIGSISVSVRRCHDIGFSGWFVLLLAGWRWACPYIIEKIGLTDIPFVELITMSLDVIVLGIKAGVPRPNKYGENPNAVPEVVPTSAEVPSKKVVVHTIKMKIKKMPQAAAKDPLDLYSLD